MWTTELSGPLASPTSWRARRLLAKLLLATSRVLGLFAAHLMARSAPASDETVIEFHGDAGAPEGALYVNGELVGRVLGVSRL